MTIRYANWKQEVMHFAPRFLQLLKLRPSTLNKLAFESRPKLSRNCRKWQKYQFLLVLFQLSEFYFVFKKLFVLSLCVLLPLLTRSHVVMGRFDVDMKEGDTGESPPSPISPFSHFFLPFCLSIRTLILSSPPSSHLPPHFLLSLPPSPSLPSSCTSVWNTLITS